MELFSYIPTSLDITTSIVVLILTVIFIYWYWIKPSLSSSTKPKDVITTIKTLQK
jgi:hypothetical protein